MPFDPLPPRFVEHLRRLKPTDPPCVELGCADGRLRDRIRAAGSPAVGLDLTPPSLGSRADLVGDARRPPLRPGSLEVVVVPNLLRHLGSAARRASQLAGWVGLLRAGGAVYVFEDEPAAEPAPRRNYRELQDFLAALSPGRRGSLLTSDAVDRCWRPGDGWRVAAGGRLDNVWPLDAEAVLEMLRGDGGRPAPRVAALIAAIEREGISPGGYWWRCLVRA